MVTRVQDTTQSAVTGTAGPAEPIPVAVLARTSTLVLQDPLASLRRQIRSCQDWLPPGWRVAGYYWDVESGGIDLEERRQGRDWRAVRRGRCSPRRGHGRTARRGPRAAAPVRRRRLRRHRTVRPRHLQRAETGKGTVPDRESRCSPPTSPPASKASTPPPSLSAGSSRASPNGSGSSSKRKRWKGLKQHSLDGWNIGPAPYGYLADRVPHPPRPKPPRAAPKAASSPTPTRAPSSTQIFHWRVDHKLSVPTITCRLNGDPRRLPATRRRHRVDRTHRRRDPGATPSTPGTWSTAAPATTPARKNPGPSPRTSGSGPPNQSTPPSSTGPPGTPPRPIGAERGNIRDPEQPTTQPGRRYTLRSRMRCRACQRRMYGIWRPDPTKTDPDDPHLLPVPPQRRQPPPRRRPPRPPPRLRIRPRRQPSWPPSAAFLDQYVFGHDRAALLAAQLPATAAGQADRKPRRQAATCAPNWPASTPPNAPSSTELEQPADRHQPRHPRLPRPHPRPLRPTPRRAHQDRRPS